MDVTSLYDGTIVLVHEAEWCVPPCAVHSPSDHPLKTAPLRWSNSLLTFFRLCEHGIHHPDPDSLAFQASIMASKHERQVAFALSLQHGSRCDGCCNPAGNGVSSP